MIVYRDSSRTVSTAQTLAALGRIDSRDHASIRELLIEFGCLECGIADSLAPRPLLEDLRRVALLTGRLFYRSLRNFPWHPCEWRDALVRLNRAALPEQIEFRTPEGYAFYALFPESYAAAAEQFYRELHPRRATVIGIRSIGTSLSAAVAGALAELGVEVRSFTVRPRGHPFDRSVELPAIAQLNEPHLIVDEGPGLSGSSFASVAAALSQAGVADAQIFLFPSWTPDASLLNSEKGRDCWSRYRVFRESAEPEAFGGWRDISAGRWRKRLFGHAAHFPPVHPQHERRKFLSRTEPLVMAKFAGLGARGRASFERARALHDARFATAPLELFDGFLFSAFVPGRPAREVSANLLRTAACYLAHVFREFPSAAPASSDPLFRMMTNNVSEALGRPWDPPRELLKAPEDWRLCDLDGRMLLHEWIETASGYVKSDAADHADDHFFPGPQDIAWDVAAAVIEFSLDDPAPFLDLYARSSGDRTIARRFPFYALAYSAFRYGYCQFAATQVQPAERRRFQQAANRYLAWINRSIR